jgi:hypothetical protein
VLKSWWLKSTTSARKPPMMTGSITHECTMPNSQLHGFAGGYSHAANSGNFGICLALLSPSPGVPQEPRE